MVGLFKSSSVRIRSQLITQRHTGQGLHTSPAVSHAAWKTLCSSGIFIASMTPSGRRLPWKENTSEVICCSMSTEQARAHFKTLLLISRTWNYAPNVYFTLGSRLPSLITLASLPPTVKCEDQDGVTGCWRCCLAKQSVDNILVSKGSTVSAFYHNLSPKQRNKLPFYTPQFPLTCSSHLLPRGSSFLFNIVK